MFKSKFKTTGDYTKTGDFIYQTYAQKQNIVRIKPSKSFDGYIRRTNHLFGQKRVIISGEMNGYGFHAQGSSYRLAKVAAKKLTRFNA